MIVVDTSALVAILLGEPDAEELDNILFAAPACAIATPTAFEFLLVLERRRGPEVREQGRQLMDANRIELRPWTAEHVELAEQAFVRFGKGRHPAALNYGDCMSYALAKSLECPLLFKGEDFAKTDIVRAS